MNQILYDKANSILEIRGLEKKREIILEHLFKIKSKSKDLIKTDPLNKALEDLFVNNNKNLKKPKFHLRDHIVVEMSKLDIDHYGRYLRYRYAYELNPLNHFVDKFPPLVQIEPTSICNYRCVFCYQTDLRLTKKKNGHMGMMSLENFKNIIDQLEGNIEGITLASRGEPTVNKCLPEMIKYMSGKFLATKINTNAYLLNEKICHALLDSDLQTLVISADAASDKLYSQLRVNGKLDRVLKNVQLLKNIKEKYYPSSKIITRVSGVRFSREQDINEMEQFWNHLVDQVAFVDYNPWENVYDSEKNKIEKPCSDLWRRMFIWWDGRVAPCDTDYLTKLSHETIYKSSISEIWNGKMYTKLRQKHLSGYRQNLEPCSRCVVI